MQAKTEQPVKAGGSLVKAQPYPTQNITEALHNSVPPRILNEAHTW